MADRYLILSPDADQEQGYSAYDKFWILNDRIERYLGIPNQYAKDYAFPIEHPDENDFRVVLPVSDKAAEVLTEAERDALISADALEAIGWLHRVREVPSPGLLASLIKWWKS